MHSVCMLFIIAFLQTGISNSSITISTNEDGDRIVVRCVLSGNEKLTQVSWEIQHDSNQTKLGTFHPVYATHIFPEYVSKVKIEGKSSPDAFSSLSMEKVALNKTAKICCLFAMFPSGSLTQCTRISDYEKHISPNINKAEAQQAGHELGFLGQLGALIIGCVLFLLLLLLPVYIFQKCFCGRKQVFEVQQTYLTDPSPSTDTFTEEVQDVHHTSQHQGFDPAKLYAKIKEDLYYGRLWKAYQGSARVSAQRSGQRQIYYRLGENPLVQRDEEDRPKNTGTETPSLDGSGIVETDSPNH